MEEIRPQYHLKIYIDNIYCDIGEHASCPRSITVSYNDQVITLRNHIGGADLEVRPTVRLRKDFHYVFSLHCIVNVLVFFVVACFSIRP